MERDPRDLGRNTPRNDVAGTDDVAFDTWMEAVPGLPETDEEIAAADAQAEADIAAGRYYPHEVVGEWLKTWGDADFKPFKEWLAPRDG